MTRFAILALLAIVISCRSTQSQLPDATPFTGTKFDVDINGRYVIVDGEKNTVRLVEKNGREIAEIGGSGWGDDQFDKPAGVWARNGIDIFIADYGNHRIQRFDRNLAFISSFSTRDRSNPDERFGYPTDIAISRLGDLFVCDGENLRVLKVNSFSKTERIFGGFDAGKGRLKRPNQIEVGPGDKVYVQDGSEVVVFDNFGNYVQRLGEGIFQGQIQIYADDNGLAVLSENKLFFFDSDERLIQTTELTFSAKEMPKTFALSRGTIFFLTASGLLTTTDPRY